ncbi:MAG: alpha-ketoacid dehydrogenase subunit beta [Anaerolineae bacterium]|jgi:2-oxoisovalerate dehydrogenase E1 component beta subunit|nr:alpha-ketoacid dehydrogenase subunit beta [Anaerolineae bacterium]
MPVKSNIEALRDTMAAEMRRDPTIIITGEDVGQRGGVFRATEGLFAEFGPSRVIDSPLSELSIVGVGIGMALNGIRPICEIQFADFIHPAFNQIVNEAAKMRYRSNGQFCCPMVIRAPYGGGISGALYHSQSIEAFFCHVPGLYVLAPSTPYDTAGLLRSALRSPDPVLFLEHKKLYRAIKGEVPEGDFHVPIGRAEVKRAGDDMTIISYGLMLHESLKAADALAKEGVAAEVIDLRTLAPLDKDTILTSVKKTGKALIVYEDNYTGGLGGEIAAIIAENAFEYLDGPITRVAGPDIPAMPFSHPMQDFFLPNAEKIAAAARTLAAY